MWVGKAHSHGLQVSCSTGFTLKIISSYWGLISKLLFVYCYCAGHIIVLHWTLDMEISIRGEMSFFASVEVPWGDYFPDETISAKVTLDISESPNESQWGCQKYPGNLTPVWNLLQVLKAMTSLSRGVLVSTLWSSPSVQQSCVTEAIPRSCMSAGMGGQSSHVEGEVFHTVFS